MRLCDFLTDAEQLSGSGTDLEVAMLTADSRLVEPGALFAALPGVSADGAKYVSSAVDAGAVAVLAGEGADLPELRGVALVRSPDPRRSLARMAARFHGPQPEHLVAVTGTNGKTSVAAFVAQIWAALGYPSASIGTLGVLCERNGRIVEPPAGVPPVKLTSPDPVVLHQALQGLGEDGFGHVAIEASSHGLEQRRLDGVCLAGGAFTNITRDHLDYHLNFQNYQSAKLRLFDTVLEPGGLAVVNRDGAGHEAAIAAAEKRGLKLLTHGRAQGEVRLVRVDPTPEGLDIVIGAGGRNRPVGLNLVGGFQAENAVTALCLATAAGCSVEDGLAVLGNLKGVCGRLQPVGKTAAGGAVFIDYAHTPDALKTAIAALRPHVAGRIVTVFGAAGDRDAGKRPLMGQAAAAVSDLMIVTDDNPRSEDSAMIRRTITAACPGAIDIAGRAEAIAAGMEKLQAGDALLVAGKGHERGQEIDGIIHPFSDHEVVAGLIGDGSRG